jgi:hypothetical protein
MTLDLTETEAQNLLQLLDVAVKAAGLQAAQVALPIAAKIQQAASKEQSNG